MAVEPAIIVKDPPAKPTTLMLDKKGVKVETKKLKYYGLETHRFKKLTEVIGM